MNGSALLAVAGGLCLLTAQTVQAAERCPLTADRPDGAVASPPLLDFVVAEDLDAAELSCDERSPAQLSFKSDNQNSTREYSIKGVVVWSDLFRHPDPNLPENAGKGVYTPRLSPFIGLDRESNADPTSNVDDLIFGARAEFRIPVGSVMSEGRRLIETHPIYLTGSWTTDTAHFNSSFSKVEISTPLPLARIFRIGPPPYTGFWNGAADPDRLRPLFKMTALLVADYVDVADAGGKAALIATPSYSRAGYNVDADLRLGRGEDTSSWWLTASYKQRFRLSGASGASVHLFDAGLEFRPSDRSPYSFNLTYERGRTLDSLTPVDTLSIGIGFKH